MAIKGRNNECFSTLFIVTNRTLEGQLDKGRVQMDFKKRQDYYLMHRYEFLKNP